MRRGATRALTWQPIPHEKFFCHNVGIRGPKCHELISAKAGNLVPEYFEADERVNNERMTVDIRLINALPSPIVCRTSFEALLDHERTQTATDAEVLRIFRAIRATHIEPLIYRKLTAGELEVDGAILIRSRDLNGV